VHLIALSTLWNFFGCCRFCSEGKKRMHRRVASKKGKLEKRSLEAAATWEKPLAIVLGPEQILNAMSFPYRKALPQIADMCFNRFALAD
jgi:hypothetical protein